MSATAPAAAPPASSFAAVAAAATAANAPGAPPSTKPPAPIAPKPTKASRQEVLLNLNGNDPWVSIQLARRRLAKYLPPTLLRPGRTVDGYDLYYKCEFLRRTGSFKERGGLNALLSLTDEEKKVGVIAASAGNHSQALAYWGFRLNVPVTVVMPTKAPLTKVENCRHYKATVILHGANFGEAKQKAEQLSDERHLKYINGYNDLEIIAGAGTCGLEILDELPDVDAIVVPVGGGGLIAGVALAVKRINPAIKVIGVESEKCPSMTNALKAGKPVMTDVGHTIAEGLAVPEVGPEAFHIVKNLVDEVHVINERWISRAIVHLLEKEKMLVEGAGCTGLAAVMSGALQHLKGKKIVTLLCGGNIDISVLGRVIERGLYSSGRMMQFDCAISDKVGGLARFTRCLAETNCSVREIVQERPFISDINVCSVHVTVETLSRAHCEEIKAKMREQGFVLFEVNDSKYDSVPTSKL